MFAALIADYNLEDDDGVQRLRATLDELKDGALAAETEGFEAPQHEEELVARVSTESTKDEASFKAGDEPSHLGGKGESCSLETDETTLSDAASRRNPKGSSSRGEGSSEEENQAPDWSKVEILDPEGKQAFLMEMFPDVQDVTILQGLKETGNNVKRVIEELLNHVFIQQGATGGDENVKPKGIDGFAVPEEFERGRRRKGRRKTQHTDANTSSPVTTNASMSETTDSKWKSIEDDVRFISSRTGLRMRTITSFYHENGASMSSTIQAILEAESREIAQAGPNESIIQANAVDLGQEFPSISSQHLLALIRLTHPSTASAHELAKALVKRRPESKERSGIEIITRLPPIDLSSHSTRSSSRTKVPEQQLPISAATAAALSSSFALARQTAFSQASTAHRRSNSNNLMGAAASYYSDLGRAYGMKAKQYSAVAADAWVEANSSGTELDLHGVSVRDAVRLASEKVNGWWIGLGDARFGGRPASTRCYRIITGVGNHSEDGRGKIGPAVGRMLMREGWKVQIGTGTLTVSGR